MSFPQPSSDQYAISGSQFFALNTPLSSPGDIYESTQGGHGLALGPQSDIANVNVAYFDQQVPTFMQRVVISPGRAFVGRIDARNDTKYAPAQRPGRILFWSDDLFDPNFRPRGFGVQDSISFVAPILDVIQYFKPLASLTSGRQDKEFVFQNYIVGTGTFYIVVPYYGRKYCYVEFTNREVTPNTFGIIGVNYAITQNDTLNPYHQETTIRAAAAVAGGAQVTKIITAAALGVFDALVFSVTSPGPAPLRILMSDEAQGL